MPFRILDKDRLNRFDNQPVMTIFEQKSCNPCRMDRVADALLQQGFHRQAERLSNSAADLRAVSQ